MKTSEARDTIYLDIETFSGEQPRLDSFTAKANLVDPVKIAKDLEEKRDKAWRAQSLDPFKGEVYCIGIAYTDEPAFCLIGASTDEEETMELLETELSNRSNSPTIIGHNILDFDAHWLFVKGLKYKLPHVVSAFSDKTFLRDTMKAMDGSSWKKMVSLDKMAKNFGFAGKGDIHGGKVHDMILDNRGDKVCKYCISDVEILRKCSKELSQYGLI